MADIRCPMCGKSNPPDREVCQYCQARLKPLIAPSPHGDQGNFLPGKNGDDEVPDWLKDLGLDRGETDFEWGGDNDQAEVSQPKNDGEDASDWLSRLGGVDLPEAEDAAGSTRMDESDSSYDFETGEADDQVDHLHDWLDQLGTEENQEAQELEAEVPSADLPDWLKSPSPTDESQEPGDVEEPNDNLPDWLNTSGKEENQPSPEADDHPESLPDWLSQPGIVRSQEPEDPGAALHEWLAAQPEREEDPGEEQPLEPSDGMPDWLDQLGKDASLEKDEAPVEPTKTEDAEPDWLTRVRSRQKEDLEKIESFGIDMDESPASDEAQEAESSEVGAGSELPDWLTSGQSSDFTDESSASEAPSLNDLVSSESEPSDEIGSDAKLPDWLQNSNQQTNPFANEEDEDQETGELEPGEDLPDWLSSLPAQSFDSSASGSVHPLIFDEEEEELAAADELTANAVPGDDALLPDWISQVSTEDGQGDESSQADETDSDLAPAQLPSWLEAMRPVESAVKPYEGMGEEHDGDVESAGPLAGLRGILPAEPEYAHLRKPPAYTMKLRITDTQQGYLEKIEKLLETETKPKTLPSKPVVSSQHIVRLVIALVLIAVTLAPILMNTSLMPSTAVQAIPEPVQSTFALVNALPPEAVVLLAFDYQPGLIGEMEPVGSAVVSQLVRKGAYLYGVSTMPEGPLVASRFFASLTDATGQPYAKTVNLGYIAGGASGLLGFVQNPQAILPNDLSAYSDPTVDPFPWLQPPLSSVKDLSDFTMVVVLTEDPEVARTWIEQAKPALAAMGKPLVMAVSAQAEPLVYPYYAGGERQVNGIVGGLAGAQALDRLTGQQSFRGTNQDAFGAGILVGAIAILLGGLISLGLAGLERRKRPIVEEAL